MGWGIGMRRSSFHTGVAPLLIGVCMLASASSPAAPLSRQDVPGPLQPWVPWVLHGAQERQCPYFYNNGEQRQCSWSSRMTLAVTGTGGSFSLQVAAFRTLWMQLPGDAKHWPQEVKVDGKPAPVVAQADRPGVRVTPGSHAISGNFVWDGLPESLLLPDAIGLVELTTDGARNAVPNLDSTGRLWLKQRSERNSGVERIEVRVNRRVTDDIPLTMTTQIELTASGKNQEALVPNALLDGFTPLALSSPLPAHFEPDGSLRVQVRPGRWQLFATGRSMAPQTKLGLPATQDRLAPSAEVWAFEARPELRLVTIEGLTAVDPQQTTLPQEWKRFPAYLLKPGDAMRLRQTKRGDPEPEPDRLALRRHLWLDFDGAGYTVQDKISGSITRAWRLEMAKPQTLGRVAVDGADQYITQLDANALPGVELRRGVANITADSRIDTGTHTLSATGWQQDFNQLSATLHLPPGWRLLHASGADRAPRAWIERWTLLDFFLVLMITLASGKLFGWRWGVVALAALTLSYHESGAPTWAWLNLLAAAALLRVLRDGRLRNVVSLYRWLSLTALIVVAVPFAVDQVRQALYPVLERPWQAIGEQVAVYAEPEAAGGMAQNRPVPAPARGRAPASSPLAAQNAEPSSSPPPAQPEEQDRVEKKTLARHGTSYELSSSGFDRASFERIDPNAQIQTGPGLPQWTWNEYELAWSGPVEHTQTLRLWLVSPLEGKVLTAARLAALLALLARLAWVGAIRLPAIGRAAGTTAIVALLACTVAIPPHRAWAQSMPNPELLNELRDKLLAAPDCLPRCAEISRLRLSATAGDLQLRLEAHAETDTAIPLPGGAQQWLPEELTVDGAPARGLMRDRTGNLWVQLAKGVHQIGMRSGMNGRHSVQLALPLKPHRVEAELVGWTLDGLGEDGQAGESLLLTRVAGATRSTQPGSGDSLPPFVRVERTFNLGLVWQVATRVVRAGPSTAPVLVKVPLLEGESVTDGEVRAQDGVALVNLGPQTNAFYFESALKQRKQLDLRAPAESNQIQVWRLNLGPQWHVQFGGIPVVHHQDDAGRWLPEWRPWPDEHVTLALTKPSGVAGQTLTLDRTRLSLAPGIRATDVQLDMTLRSSRGGQHVVQLPEGAALQSVAIDGKSQPIRLEGRGVHLPVSPGKQEVTIAWREPRGISTWFAASSADAGTPGVNAALQIKMPEGRWLLLVGGPAVGPAILFWGVVIVLALAALALGRMRLTPLKAHQWFLLALGLTQAPLLTGVIVVAWFLGLGARKRFGDGVAGKRWFNLGQVVLALLTLAAALSLFWAVQNGLLGYPEMQVAGNGSDVWNLRWYQDRTPGALPTAWVISVPLIVYRLLMLAWALWLAYSLLGWARWGWDCFSDHGYWRKLDLWNKHAASKHPTSEAGGAPVA